MYMTLYYHLSKEDDICEESKDNIYLIQQFFIHSNIERHKEILYCLKSNTKNEYITKIYLLNEKIYTQQELGLNDTEMKKVIQTNINTRLTYYNIFKYVEEKNLNGYIIFSNSDIFFNKTLKNLYKSSLSYKKGLYGLLRFEYTPNKKLEYSKLFGPIGDSQDTWIYHSKYNPSKKKSKIFKFTFGRAGCDNKLLYLFHILGYNIYNEPYKIKTYHYHSTKIRNYNRKDKLNPPYLLLFPHLPQQLNYDLIPYEKSSKQMTKNYTICQYDEINTLSTYIKSKIDKNENFVIPRIAGTENRIVFYSNLLKNKNNKNKVMPYISREINTMKSNAGIKITNLSSLEKYAELYLSSFQNSELYFTWEPWGGVYRFYNKSINFITNTFKTQTKLWATNCLDLFHHIYNIPWTLSLKGKRILVICAFTKSINKQLGHLKEIYGIDLFPDCEFILLKPPQTQGSNNSKEWNLEFNDFCKEIDKVKDNYDIALVSCGGYGNLVCDYIYNSGKSAIYVGGVLQMYFGIIGKRWLEKRSEVLELFLNTKFTRPMEEEKPKDYKKIENACYW